MEICRDMRAYFKNPIKSEHRLHDSLEATLWRELPYNAHELCSGRLGLSLTKLWSLENKFVTHFETKKDLIDALTSSCFIPIWSGRFEFPYYKGAQYIDGAYSDNSPSFNPTAETGPFGVRRIQLQAFSGYADVSPKDDHYLTSFKVFGSRYHISWNNVLRSKDAMYPATLKGCYYHTVAGYCDMKRFILNNDFIRCEACHLHRARGYPYRRESKPCVACLKLLEKVDGLEIPECVRQMIGMTES